MSGPTETTSVKRLRSEAGAVQSEIERVCETAAERLFAVLDDMGEVTEILARVAEIAGPVGRERIRRFAADAGTYTERIEEQFAFLSDVSDLLRKQAQQLQALLTAQNRNLRLASIIATNAKVVSRTIGNSDGELLHFAEDVRGMLLDAGQSIARLHADLTAADAQLRKVGPEIEQMTAAAKRLTQIRERLPVLTQELSQNRDLEDIAEHARAGTQTMMRALHTAVTELQSGDAARQRLEHVLGIVDRVDDDTPPVDRWLERLASAQFGDTVDDLESAIEVIRPQLDRIAKTWLAAKSDIEQASHSAALATLSQITEMAGTAARGLEALDRARASIEPDIKRLSELYGKSAKTAETISGLERRMQLLGINAILVSGRIGSRGRAMAETSLQLRESTSNIADVTGRIVELAKLQEMNAGVFLAPTEEARGGAVASGLASLETSVAELHTLVGTLLTAVGEDTVQTRLAEIGTDLSHLMPRVRDLFSVSQDSDPLSEPGPAFLRIAREIRETYTMSAERRVHDRLVTPDKAGVPPEPDTNDALDGVFF